MGLTSDIQGHVTRAFVALGDLSKTGTITEIGTSTVYDSATDTHTRATTPHPLTHSILVGFEEKEIDGTHVKETDFKGLVPAEQLSGYQPKTSDKFTDYLGNDYSIERAKTVPGDSIWILQLRLI